MPAIPPFVLKNLYVKGSLRAEADGFALDLKNSIAPAIIVAFTGLDVDGQPVPASQITIIPPGGDLRTASDISAKVPLSFPADATIALRVAGHALDSGPHELFIHVLVQDAGLLDLPISGTLVWPGPGTKVGQTFESAARTGQNACPTH